MSESIDAEVAPPEAATSTNEAAREPRDRSGLLTRIAIALGALALALALVFVVLIVAVAGLRDRSFDARRSEQVIATANGLQTLVIDFETGLRGYAITGNKRYLDPWYRAKGQFPTAAEDLMSLTADDPKQQALARKGFIERDPSRSRGVRLVGYTGVGGTTAGHTRRAL